MRAARFLARFAAHVVAINAITMFLAAISSDWFAFGVSWIGASFACAGHMWLKEEMRLDNMGYRDLATRLRWEIKEENDFAADGRLPNHTQIANRFGAARTTVRRALQVLVDEGLVEVIHGKGTFVIADDTARAGRAGMVEQHIRRNAGLGLPIESTDALALSWSVSRSTASRVVRRLVTEGVIRRTRKGGFEAA